jgi:hypothetical protein
MTIEPLPPELVAVLPPATAEAWGRLAPHVPTPCYLAGGTGLTCHLRHRVSRDLDFMFDAPVDLVGLERVLEGLGDLAVDRRGVGTLNAVLDSTKLQFLDVAGQPRLAATIRVGGIEVASVEDIAAMKVQVIGDRGELSDYFDLMVVDQQVLPVEEAIALFRERFGADGEQVAHVVRGLGYFDDVGDDPALPVARGEIEAFWTARTAEVVRRLRR